MNRRAKFIAVLWAILFTACSSPKLQFPAEPERPRVSELARIPFTDWTPSPSNRREAELRKIRDASYNAGSREYMFFGLAGTCFVDRAWVARGFTGSATVVLATVTQAQSRLSGDRRNLYTEWMAKVEEIWEQFGPPGLEPGAELLMNRIGGAIRMPSGEKFETTVVGLSGPLYANRRYVLFLRYRPKQQWFNLEKAWEIQGGRMIAVDPEDGWSAWQGASVAAYRNAYNKFKTDSISTVRDTIE